MGGQGDKGSRHPGLVDVSSLPADKGLLRPLLAMVLSVPEALEAPVRGYLVGLLNLHTRRSHCRDLDL